MVQRARPAIQRATLPTNSGWHVPADPCRSHAWLMPDLPGKGSAADACHQMAWSRLAMWQVVVGITPPSPSRPALEPQILRQQHTTFDLAPPPSHTIAPCLPTVYSRNQANVWSGDCFVMLAQTPSPSAPALALALDPQR